MRFLSFSFFASLLVAWSFVVNGVNPAFAAGEEQKADSSAQETTEGSQLRDDYYQKRATKILEKASSVRDATPHPLSKAYPGDFVIVCEAGCRGRKAEIVSREPREAVKVVSAGRLVTLSASSEVDQGLSENVLVCLAGCRPGSVVIPSAPPQVLDPSVPVTSFTHPAASEFKTTIGPESGRWLAGGTSETKPN